MFQAYLVTCATTGKRYVGITSRPLSRRWVEHVHGSRQHQQKSALLCAIAKYGPADFIVGAVCCARSWVDICAVEAILIAQLGTLAPFGYNLTLGGEGRHGYRPSKDAVERSAAKHRGRPCHPNTRAAASRAHLGQPKSAEHRARIAAAKTGGSRSAETRSKISAYWSERRSRGDFKTSRPYEHCAK